jgi:hypothetical protein
MSRYVKYGRLNKYPLRKYLCVKIALANMTHLNRRGRSQLVEEMNTRLETWEIFKFWSKRQKQELLDEIKRLKEENKRLNKQNSQLMTQMEIKK